MKFSIVTPSFCQLELLRLCVASVRDQVGQEEIVDSSLLIEDSLEQSEINNNQSTISKLCVEHIIQDAGTPGIEEFAREVGAAFYRDGEKIFDSSLLIADSMRGNPVPQDNSESRYRLAVYCEADCGMYDAINRGLKKSSGHICAWLNCDEQYLSGALATVGAFMKTRAKVEMLIGDTILLNERLEPRSYRRGVPPCRKYLQAFQLGLHSSSLFFRRELLKRGVWLGDRFRSIGDAEWIAHLLDQGVHIHPVARPLSTFVLGANNLSVTELSVREKEAWRRELSLSQTEKLVVKLRYNLQRFRAGAFRPRREPVAIFTPANPETRSPFPARWLDFRFRV